MRKKSSLSSRLRMSIVHVLGALYLGLEARVLVFSRHRYEISVGVPGSIVTVQYD